MRRFLRIAGIVIGTIVTIALVALVFLLQGPAVPDHSDYQLDLATLRNSPTKRRDRDQSKSTPPKWRSPSRPPQSFSAASASIAMRSSSRLTRSSIPTARWSSSTRLPAATSSRPNSLAASTTLSTKPSRTRSHTRARSS